MEILGIEVKLVRDPNVTGTLIREYVSQRVVKNDKGENEIREVPVCVVAWDNKRVPALHYHNPAELEWVSFMPAVVEYADEEEYEEEEEEETNTIDA